jgi:hypothetical protein
VYPPSFGSFTLFDIGTALILHAPDADCRLQDAQKVFNDALAGEDVEKNDEGAIALHGVTYLFWTSNVPA